MLLATRVSTDFMDGAFFTELCLNNLQWNEAKFKQQLQTAENGKP